MDCGPDEVTPLAQIGRIQVPVLLAHGRRDRRIPAAELDRLVSAADPARVTRLLVAGSNHRSLLTSIELAEGLADFLGSALEKSVVQQERLNKVA